jgi:hypothetical protein
MQVKQLLKQLEGCDPEATVAVSAMISHRVLGFHKAELLVGINAVETGSGKPKDHVFYPNRDLPDEGEEKMVCLVCEGV